MIIKHIGNPIRANKVVIDLEGNDEEIVHFRVHGKDAHVSVRTDGTADGVVIEAGGKMYRQPVDGNDTSAKPVDTDTAYTKIHGICNTLQGIHRECDEVERLLDSIVVKIANGGYEFEDEELDRGELNNV
jgi:hypothetical protein